MANLFWRGERVKRFRPVPRRWDEGEVVAATEYEVWVVWDGTKKAKPCDPSKLQKVGRTTTTGSIVRPYTRERPERDDEPTVRQVSERLRKRRRVGDAIGRRFHSWLRRIGRCQWCERTDRRLEVDHWPSRGAGGDDLLCHLLCDLCHRHRHDHGRLPQLTAKQTKDWMRDTQRSNLAGFVRAEAEAA